MRVNRSTFGVISCACDISLGEAVDFDCVVKLSIFEKIQCITIQSHGVQVEVRLLINPVRAAKLDPEKCSNRLLGAPINEII